MADLDDELLALVGGDEDDNDTSDPGLKDKSASPAPAADRDQASPDTTDKMGRKGVARPVPKRKKRVSKKVEVEEGEDGEMYVTLRAQYRCGTIKPSLSRHPLTTPLLWYFPWCFQSLLIAIYKGLLSNSAFSSLLDLHHLPHQNIPSIRRP